MKKNLTEQQLIELLHEDHHRYFSFFSSHYEAYILKRCRSYVKDDDTAEDLCQEVLIRVFVQFKKFQGKAKFTTWLYTIIHHTCIDYLRKNNKKTKPIIAEKIADQFNEMVDFDEELPLEKTLELLDELLGEMNEEERLILLLKYKEKNSLKDISLSLNISESALKMRLKRAKAKLNQLYKSRL